MSWARQRNHTVWVVQRISTGKVIIVYDRLHSAKAHVADDPTTKWTRKVINHAQ